jgi:Na+-translocating ferredoxin:NAD+ oxidoreductase RnfD subunit
MAPVSRKVTIRGREYRVLPPSLRDPRLHVAAVLLTLQALGQTVLSFRLSIAQIVVCLLTGALIEFGYEFFRSKAIMWPASGLLTGNSTAFILRAPGTYHGDWWSLHAIWIFVAVVAVAMASKYLIRWRGRHIFNPSNFALVLAFVALGPRFTEPQDLWWIPMGPWLIVTYAILIGGGLLIAWELKLLGLELGYMAGFALFAALALLPVSDHCMIASWYATPICGQQLWQVLVTSPEVLIFALFMVPDPRTVPESQLSRLVFGVIVAFLSVLLIGPTILEFWTKTAILASLVVACAGRFALVRLLESLRPVRWAVPAAGGVSLVLLAALPLSAAASLHATEPAPELPDGSTPKLSLTVGGGPDAGSWAIDAAFNALPPPSGTAAASSSDRVWVLPPIPRATIPDNVLAFYQGMTPALAQSWAHDAVLDLVIESEARRTHDTALAETGATGDDALKGFTDVIAQDVAAAKFVQVTYSFDRVQLTLFLPRFSTQARRLVGVTLHGTATLVTRNASGRVLSTQTVAYGRSWGLGGGKGGNSTHLLLVNDYTDLKLA